MNTLTKNTLPTTEPSSSTPYWAEELDSRHARFRAKIGGLHCSLCTGTLEKALGRLPGVEKVAVSLTHEQALVEYDPRHPESPPVPPAVSNPYPRVAGRNPSPLRPRRRACRR